MDTIKGRVRALSISDKRGTSKVNVPEAHLKAGHGILGDAHAGNWHRQVSLLAVESVNRIVAQGTSVSPGDFGENITVEGMDLLALRVGSRLKIGSSAELEVTQLGKHCHGRCAIFERVGDCIMPQDGIFARVTKSGQARVGDVIEVVND